VDRRDRLRRVVILCCYFARNLAFYRAGNGYVSNSSPQFWITAYINFLDTAVLDWCKLLGDPKGNHYWQRVVFDATRFELELLTHLGITADELAAYVTEMRTYRDKFLAHLDDLKDMNVPKLDRAKVAVEFYHGYVVHNEANPGDLEALPGDLPAYYSRSFGEARSIYRSL
jgi:hypothetical protein